MLRNRAKRKYGTIAQEIQYSEFYRTAINWNECCVLKRAVGKFKDAKPIARSASINDYSTACYARAVRNIDGH